MGQGNKWPTNYENSETHDFGQTNVTINKRIIVQNIPSRDVEYISHTSFRSGQQFGKVYLDKAATHRVVAALDGHLLLPKALQSSTGTLPSL